MEFLSSQFKWSKFKWLQRVGMRPFSLASAVTDRVIALLLVNRSSRKTRGSGIVTSASVVFSTLVTQTPFTALVKEDARYTPGTISCLGNNPRPSESVGTLIMCSDLAFKVRRHGSFLIEPDLVSKPTTTSSFMTIWREQ